MKKVCLTCKKEFNVRGKWANKSGEYKRQLSDYFSLCVPCHKKYDLQRKLRKCAFIPVDDRLFYASGAHIAVNSFKRFHPDIDLIVFRQDVIDRLFREKGINWYQAKPFFAELLFDSYDLICNLDSDHVFTGRLTEVFDNVDYDVAMPTNFNDYENASFENITEEMYLQAGMVASTSKKFWLKWQKMNRKAMDYLRKENDIVNLLIYNEMPKLKLKVLDKDKDYYGCKSLGREPLFYIDDDKLMCKHEQVLAYHFARGNHFPKLDFNSMPFKDGVKEWLNKVAFQGNTVKVVGL